MIKYNTLIIIKIFMAIGVVVSHFSELKDGNRSNEILTQIFNTVSLGELSVILFFCLSGYLIAHSYTINDNFINFITSRILRIYPAFIFNAIILYFFIQVIYSNIGFSDLKILKFFYNLIKLNLISEGQVFVGSYYPVMNGSLWSIPYEFCFYLMVPILIKICKKHHKFLYYLISTLILMILISNYSKYLFANLMVLKLLTAFIAGVVFFRYDLIVKNNIMTLTLTFILFFIMVNYESTAFFSILCLFNVIINALKYEIKLLHSFKIHDISYGIYLWGWPVNKIVLHHLPNLNNISSLLITILITICMAFLSLFIIEKKADNFKNYIKLKYLNK